MTNGKIWLVVKPTVGVPLLLIGVVVSALAVHTALLANTTWFAKYWEGKAPARAALVIDSPVIG